MPLGCLEPFCLAFDRRSAVAPTLLLVTDFVFPLVRLWVFEATCKHAQLLSGPNWIKRKQSASKYRKPDYTIVSFVKHRI